MNTVKGELTTFEAVKDLKTLLSANGPCLSIYIRLSSASKEGVNPPYAKENELNWRESVRKLGDKVAQFGSTGRDLLNSVSSWDAVAPEAVEKGTAPGKSIAVFRSSDSFHVTLLDSQVEDITVLGPHFYVRPLLAELCTDHTFYLLALSQRNTRLLRCTMHTSEELSLPGDVKNDFDQWMNQVKPDHTAVTNAMTGGTQGSQGPNALAPKGADQDSKNEYLSHYFKQVDRGVNELLKGKHEPLILCAVEYEIPLYRGINTYPHLLSEEVRGAPNGLKAGEMHARAIEALGRSNSAKIDKALAEWNHRAGGGASSRLKEVVTAAHEGRVLTLLISDSQQQTGTFDESTFNVNGRGKGAAEDEDLVNDAAVQTILHAGNVIVAPHNKMPHGSPLAAIFRY